MPLSLDSIPPENRTRFFHPDELDTIGALIQALSVRNNTVGTVVEFGCQNGRTARVLLDHFEDIGVYIGIDVPPTHQTVLSLQRGEVPAVAGQFAFADPRFRLLLSGNGSRDLHLGDLPRADVFFIDGDHSYEGVKNDTELAMTHARSSSVIIWHDYNDVPGIGVKQYLDELHAKGRPITHVAGTWLAYQFLA